jgi:hypothetical protein
MLYLGLRITIAPELFIVDDSSGDNVLALRAAWLRPKQTDLIPDKGQFRSRFHHPLSYCCPTMISLDPRNRHRHHLSATLLDGWAGTAGPGAVAIARAAVSECWL